MSICVAKHDLFPLTLYDSVTHRRKGIGIELDKYCIWREKLLEAVIAVEIVKGSYFRRNLV